MLRHKFTSVQHLEDSIKSQRVSLAQLDKFEFVLNWATKNYTVVFTQDMYDAAGKVTSWWNKATWFWLLMTNDNRYKSYQDTHIEFIQDHIIKPHISYEE